ncbi:hypothetical protein QBC35DRAFT_515158 [Podospora australis]|uniref:Methyltransferase domain-containing protein n=1 Tax=Podospora australis TaxID=1536484 RepID=A0AAN7AGP2_9PEZI|nr:hypothetical protein QBC35DRAFT_515158 [Podospora australis]
MPDFDSPIYWRKRFANETSFEWLIPSLTFLNIITPYLERLPSKQSQILHLGSGTSDLHNHLRSQGFTNVTNIDYEPLALERGKHLEEGTFGDVVMKYLVADVTGAQFSESVVARGERRKCQMVLDKSTADAVSCGGEEALVKMARGIHEVLDDGVWISMSYSDSRFEDLRVKEIFEVEVIKRVPTKKRRETDPDIWLWCYLLRPKPLLAN